MCVCAGAPAEHDKYGKRNRTSARRVERHHARALDSSMRSRGTPPLSLRPIPRRPFRLAAVHALSTAVWLLLAPVLAGVVRLVVPLSDRSSSQLGNETIAALKEQVRGLRPVVVASGVLGGFLDAQLEHGHIMLETLALAKGESDRELEEAHVKRTALSEEMQVCSLACSPCAHAHLNSTHRHPALRLPLTHVHIMR